MSFTLLVVASYRAESGPLRTCPCLPTWSEIGPILPQQSILAEDQPSSTKIQAQKEGRGRLPKSLFVLTNLTTNMSGKGTCSSNTRPWRRYVPPHCDEQWKKLRAHSVGRARFAKAQFFFGRTSGQHPLEAHLLLASQTPAHFPTTRDCSGGDHSLLTVVTGKRVVGMLSLVWTFSVRRTLLEESRLALLASLPRSRSR